jgi:hypothetical protein
VAYHDELLQQAKELVHKNPNNPTQADLRRSVSPAYYALFHLLIFEACLNWSNHVSRPGLARMFDHGVMKKVSKRVTDASRMPYAGEDPVIVDNEIVRRAIRPATGAAPRGRLQHQGSMDPYSSTQGDACRESSIRDLARDSDREDLARISRFFADSTA